MCERARTLSTLQQSTHARAALSRRPRNRKTRIKTQAPTASKQERRRLRWCCVVRSVDGWVLTNASGGRWHRRVGGGGGWRRWQGVHGVTTLALRELAAPGGARQQQQRHQPHSPAGCPTRSAPHWTAWGHCGAGGHMVLSRCVGSPSQLSPLAAARLERMRSDSHQQRRPGGREQPNCAPTHPLHPFSPPTLAAAAAE